MMDEITLSTDNAASNLWCEFALFNPHIALLKTEL